MSSLFRKWMEGSTAGLPVCPVWLGLTWVASRETQSPALGCSVSTEPVILQILGHRDHHAGKNRPSSNSSINKNSVTECEPTKPAFKKRHVRGNRNMQNLCPSSSLTFSFFFSFQDYFSLPFYFGTWMVLKHEQHSAHYSASVYQPVLTWVWLIEYPSNSLNLVSAQVSHSLEWSGFFNLCRKRGTYIVS